MAQGNLPTPNSGLGSTASPTVTTISRNDNDNDNDNDGGLITNRKKNKNRRNRSKTPPKILIPSTPPRLSHTTTTTNSDDDSLSPRPARGRVNSREYTHSYEGRFGAGDDDMVGVDIARGSGSWWEDQQWFLFTAYVIVLILVGVVVTMIVSLFSGEDTKLVSTLSGTVTNIIHFLVTLMYLHWMKGSTGYDQGDLDHLTLWEQIEATPHTSNLRIALRIVPTLLCYIACKLAGWTEAPVVCTINVVVWYLTLLGKMPFMNGVRIFGINAYRL